MSCVYVHVYVYVYVYKDGELFFRFDYDHFIEMTDEVCSWLLVCLPVIAHSGSSLYQPQAENIYGTEWTKKWYTHTPLSILTQQTYMYYP